MTDDNDSSTGGDDRPEEGSGEQPQAEQSEGTVGQRSANPTPPDAEVLTSEDTHDSPQLPPQANRD